MAKAVTLRRSVPKHCEALDVLEELADKHGSPTWACIVLLRGTLEYKVALKSLTKKRRKR